MIKFLISIKQWMIWMILNLGTVSKQGLGQDLQVPLMRMIYLRNCLWTLIIMKLPRKCIQAWAKMSMSTCCKVMMTVLATLKTTKWPRNSVLIIKEDLLWDSDQKLLRWLIPVPKRIKIIKNLTTNINSIKSLKIPSDFVRTKTQRMMMTSYNYSKKKKVSISEVSKSVKILKWRRKCKMIHSKRIKICMMAMTFLNRKTKYMKKF